MKRLRVLSVLLAACLLFSAAPALAVDAPIPVKPTAMRLAMAPSIVAYGGAASVNGSLVDASGRLVPNKRIVFQRSADGSTWTTVTTMFSTTGTYATSVPLTQRTMFRMVFKGDAVYGSATSPTRTVTCRAWLTAPGCAAKVYKGKTLNVVGYIKPRHVAGPSCVTVQADQYVGGTWKRIKEYSTATSDNYSYSKYAAGIVLPYTGQWRLRAFHGDAGHYATYSGYTYVTVAPDPTIRLSGTGSATKYFRLRKGTHTMSYSWSGNGWLGFFQLRWYPSSGTTPSRTGVSRTGESGSGSAAMSVAADTDMTLRVNCTGSWSITIP